MVKGKPRVGLKGLVRCHLQALSSGPAPLSQVAGYQRIEETPRGIDGMISVLYGNDQRPCEMPLTSPVNWPCSLVPPVQCLVAEGPPAVLVTPDPDPDGWRSEHIQSIFRAYSEHAA
jgi:hypothetical protein